MKTVQIDKKKQDREIVSRVERCARKAACDTDRQGALLALLHEVQNEFGYIPRAAMDVVSEKLSLPTAHIYGMATFYNYFSLKPKAKYKVYVCKGTACYVSGGARIIERLKTELGVAEGDLTSDGLFSMHITRCLGCCGLSPVMQVNDEVYVRMVPERVPGILAKYRTLG
ncbi:MAG: NAD(P)H-dependent oxidoreductase subunit E [Candidatus Omnitrophica bacterium]|nr:NAD(P)H-dependent oxidoreductase subunit E [Candidatus Omnitrophota bacterium]